MTRQMKGDEAAAASRPTQSLRSKNPYSFQLSGEKEESFPTEEVRFPCSLESAIQLLQLLLCTHDTYTSVFQTHGSSKTKHICTTKVLLTSTDIFSLSTNSAMKRFRNSMGAHVRSFSTTLEENFWILNCIMRPSILWSIGRQK